jgi:hypothetical protein
VVSAFTDPEVPNHLSYLVFTLTQKPGRGGRETPQSSLTNFNATSGNPMLPARGYCGAMLLSCDS